MSDNFFINPNDTFKKLMYLIKEKLKDKTELNLIASIDGSLSASRVADNLSRLNYVTINSISTSTRVVDGARKISLAIKLAKTSEFNKLYSENEEKRKQFVQEKQDQQEAYN